MKKTDDLYEQHSSHLLSFGRLSLSLSLSLSLFQNHTRNIPLSLSYTRSVRSVHYVHHPVSKSNFLLVTTAFGQLFSLENLTIQFYQSIAILLMYELSDINLVRHGQHTRYWTLTVKC